MACRQACNCLRTTTLGSRGFSSVVNGGGKYVCRRARKQEQRQLVVGVPAVLGSVTARKVQRGQIARSGMLSFSSDNKPNNSGDKEHDTVSSSSSSLPPENGPDSSIDNDAAAPEGLVRSKSSSTREAKPAAGGGEEAAAAKGKHWHFEGAAMWCSHNSHRQLVATLVHVAGRTTVLRLRFLSLAAKAIETVPKLAPLLAGQVIICCRNTAGSQRQHLQHSRTVGMPYSHGTKDNSLQYQP